MYNIYIYLKHIYCFNEGGIFIIDVGDLRTDEYVIFVSRDTDILGNVGYTEFEIHKDDSDIYMIYNKKSRTSSMYKFKMIIQEIYSTKITSKGELELPNIINKGDTLRGKYRDGYTFDFPDIVDIKLNSRRGVDVVEEDKEVD